MFNNIVEVCSDCKEEQQAEFQANIESNIQAIEEALVDSRVAFVKKAFQATDIKEYMWVRVESVDKEAKTITGFLDNKPNNDVGVQCGDKVIVLFSDVTNGLVEAKA